MSPIVSLACVNRDHQPRPINIHFIKIHFKQHFLNPGDNFMGQETHFDKQPIVFLKLGFSKAYDKVDWDFFFQVYEQAWNSR
jgi:hypothetical protein